MPSTERFPQPHGVGRLRFAPKAMAHRPARIQRTRRPAFDLDQNVAVKRARGVRYALFDADLRALDQIIGHRVEVVPAQRLQDFVRPDHVR